MDVFKRNITHMCLFEMNLQSTEKSEINSNCDVLSLPLESSSGSAPPGHGLAGIPEQTEDLPSRQCTN